MNDEIKGVIYNLGLDFERKRMASKAISVYEHIARADKNYKDIAERLKKLSAVTTTGLWQGQKASASGGAGGTMVMEGMVGCGEPR